MAKTPTAPWDGTDSTLSHHFAAPAVNWEKLPAEVNNLATHYIPGPYLAQGVSDPLPSKVLHRNAQCWRRYAWRCTPTSLFVASVTSNVQTNQPDTIMYWGHHEATVYPALQTPTVTRGTVPVKTSDDAQPFLSQFVTTEKDIRRDIPPDHADAISLFTLLPAQVRGSIIGAVPKANIWVATMVQRGVREPLHRDLLPQAHILEMLRVGDGSATVVTATRTLPYRLRQGNAKNRAEALAKVPWDVVQITYPIGRGDRVNPPSRQEVPVV